MGCYAHLARFEEFLAPGEPPDKGLDEALGVAVGLRPVRADERSKTSQRTALRKMRVDYCVLLNDGLFSRYCVFLAMFGPLRGLRRRIKSPAKSVTRHSNAPTPDFRKRGQSVNLAGPQTHDVFDLDSANQQRVGDQRTMAAHRQRARSEPR